MIILEKCWNHFISKMLLSFFYSVEHFEISWLSQMNLQNNYYYVTITAKDWNHSDYQLYLNQPYNWNDYNNKTFFFLQGACALQCAFYRTFVYTMHSEQTHFQKRKKFDSLLNIYIGLKFHSSSKRITITRLFQVLIHFWKLNFETFCW